MNKFIYILAMAIACLLSSCNVEEDYSSNKKTVQGQQAFEQVKALTDNTIHVTEMAARLSLYMETPEEGKAAIKDYFLKEYTITESATNKSISAKDEFYTWTFFHNGKTINQEGAVWELETIIRIPYQDSEIIHKRGFYTLTSTADKTWSISLKKSQLFLPPQTAHSATLKISATAAIAQASHLYNYSFTSGEGHGEGDMAYLSYQFASPIIYGSDLYRQLSMKEGEIDIIAQLPSNKQDKIKGKLQDFTTLTITMNGVTEDYDSWW